MKTNIKKLVQLLSKPFVVAWFWIFRWYRHNEFIKNLNSPYIGGPSILSRPFLAAGSGWSAFTRILSKQFNDYTLKQYVKFIPRHYARGGWGYLTLAGMSEKECLAQFNSLPSRISHYIENNPKVVSYKNRESFLDVGCGMGQTIKELVKRFPESPIHGFDVSEDALRVIRYGTAQTNTVTLEPGSAFDFEYLSRFKSGSFDHVILSHVIPHLMGASVQETLEKRQILIDQLVRISRQSVLLMSSIHHWPGDKVSEGAFVKIEQNNRCALVEPIAHYFTKHQQLGEFYMMFGPENTALYLAKN